MKEKGTVSKKILDIHFDFLIVSFKHLLGGFPIIIKKTWIQNMIEAF